MKLFRFRIEMFKSIIDSGWVRVSDLTTIVGKNEAGKTSLLKALHKLKPFKPEPYSMENEWPRGYRRVRDLKHIVCRAQFALSADEVEHLRVIAGRDIPFNEIEVRRSYEGHLEALFPPGLFDEALRPNQFDRSELIWPDVIGNVGSGLTSKYDELKNAASKILEEGRYGDLAIILDRYVAEMEAVRMPQHPYFQFEQQFINTVRQFLSNIISQVESIPTDLLRAHKYVIDRLPTFIYMDDYRAFTGTARLDEVQRRLTESRMSDQDKSLITILELAGLSLDEEVNKVTQPHSMSSEERQYDLDDASATLTKEIEGRWQSRKYEVEFRADGLNFLTFVKDEKDASLIKLEERSKGFQWFFSFDLMFMYESKGEFKNCVLLLDEPGLHLHPDAQKDLLRRLEHYAGDNTLLYTTHLPFMIDLRHPDRLRIVSEGETGSTVSEDFVASQLEGRFTVQAALGMSGSSSYLLSARNLVVEGVDDLWIISELSNLLFRSEEIGLDSEIFVTAALGASEAAYITTFMVGQKLDVTVLFDTDNAGNLQKNKLINSWLARYGDSKATVLSLGVVLGVSEEFAIEDMFPDKFFLEHVETVYKRELALAGSKLKVSGKGQICKRVERAFENLGIAFNKGRVAVSIRKSLLAMKHISELPEGTASKARTLIAAINSSLLVPAVK